MTAFLRHDRYGIHGNPQAAFMPGGHVLRNKLGIRKVSGMNLAETMALGRVQRRLYATISPGTVFTAGLICRMHRMFLGRIYPWAGQYRTVNLSKGGMLWPRWDLVPSLMAGFERRELQDCTPCPTGSALRAAGTIARVHGEFEAIHPFREGNGRLGRLLADLMSLQAGYPPLLFDDSREGRVRYLRAVGAAFGRDYRLLTDVVLDALRRAEDLARKGGVG